MQLSLAQIWSLATSMAGGRKDWGNSELSLNANLALGEVATRIHHRPLESTYTISTTSGTTEYALPTDFGYARSLSMLSTMGGPRGKNLDQVEIPWIDSQATTSGEPETWALYGTSLYLHPSPNSAYSLALRYQTTVNTMVASTATPNLDERYHMAVAYKLAELLEASRGNIQGEAVARVRYLSYMQSTPTDHALRQRTKEDMHVRVLRKAE